MIVLVRVLQGNRINRRYRYISHIYMGFPYGSAGKESTCNVEDLGLIPGLGRSPGEGKGYPLQYSGVENSMDCIVMGLQRVGHNWTTFTSYFFHFIYTYIYIYMCVYIYICLFIYFGGISLYNYRGWKKFHDLLFESWRPRKVSGVISVPV